MHHHLPLQLALQYRAEDAGVHGLDAVVAEDEVPVGGQGAGIGQVITLGGTFAVGVGLVLGLAVYEKPADLPKLYFYEETAPSLDSVYGLSKAFEEAGKERVWLKSGGYLVIQPTEALTVVDINTGKYTGKKKKDDTFLKINLEAARELARQLRLRNLSGIIVADFIDMDREEDKQTLMAVLASELKKDPVRTSLVDMTPLGLVEITRKKVQKTLAEQVNS